MRWPDSRAAWRSFRHLRDHKPAIALRRVLVVAGSATLLAAPSPASAQEDGVTFVDPGSAPAAEYAVPLNAARALGDPRKKGRGTGRASAPASPESFGAGVQPPKQPRQAAAPEKAGDPQRKREQKADASKPTTSTSRVARNGTAAVPAEDRAVDIASEMSSSLWAGAAGLFAFLLVAGVARRFQASP